MPSETKCDNCKVDIWGGDECFCKDCYDEKNEKIGELESEINDLKSQIDDLNEEINELRNKGEER